jgi:SRSO17 transposase
MDGTEFERVAASFAAFHAQFAPLFGRREARRRSEQYLRGLLVQQTDRRNAENVAEVVPGASARTLQRFLTEAPWRHEAVIDRLQAYLAPRLASDDAVFVLDETGFPKQGRQSVGVARQYSGTLGKVGNCQVGVFLGYAAARGHALIDLRLYLPQRWTEDPARCQAAGVPAGIAFQTKPQLGLAMLRQARAAGHLPGCWLTADEAYGQVPSFRDALDADGWWYVLEVPKTTPLFDQPAPITRPPWSGRGRPPTRARLAAGAPPPTTAEAVALSLAAVDWQVLTVAAGAQGPRSYQFAGRRVWESGSGLPGRETWLVLRRNLDGSELKYYLSNAPADTSLWTLGRVGALRWTVETEFQQEKGETGLDEYEVRRWAGWHHHITMALLAGAFLLTVQQDWGEKHAAPHASPGQSRPAGAVAPARLDAAGALVLAARHPAAQRPRQSLPCQAPASARHVA